MHYDLVIRDGLLVTPYDTFSADVGITGERIAAIGHDLRGQRELRARGLYVIPGAIDGHVHLTDPDYAPLYTPNADSFAVGSRAGAFGGVTSFVDFAAPKAGLDLVEALARRRAQADDQVVTDYALNLTLRDTDPTRLDQLRHPPLRHRHLAVARAHDVPVYFFTTAYHPDGRDAGMFGKKIPALLEKLVDYTASAEFREFHPIKQAATFQHQFMQIFPFAENSGKVGRTCTNLILLRHERAPGDAPRSPASREGATPTRP